MKIFYENKDAPVTAKYSKRLDFGPHLHSHIELVYMLEGCTKAVVDFKECVISSGDLFIAFPNQIHQYRSFDTENYFIAIFSADLCSEFYHIFKNKVPFSPVVKNASENNKIPGLVADIEKACREKSAFHDTLVKGYFLVLLSEIFQMMKLVDAKSSDTNTIKTILNYCMENYHKDIQLKKLAEELHISRYHISRLFSQKLHMGFNEYISMLRVSDACKLLLSKDRSVTEIAYGVGFNSTRSFNRSFLKYMGTTPRQYKNQQYSGGIQMGQGNSNSNSNGYP